MGHQELFGTDMSNIEEFNTVYVNSLSAYTSPISNVITFDTTIQYLQSKPVNYGINQLKVPDDGLVQLTSTNFASNIFTTEISGTTAFFIGNISLLIITELNALSINGGHLFDISDGTSPGFVFLDRASVQDFDSIGTIENCTFSSENVGFVNCNDGITLRDMAFVVVSEISFVGQSGDHIILTDSILTGVFNSIIATPVSGDALFNIDSAITITDRIVIHDNLFSDAAGGTLFAAGGLDQTDPRIVAYNNGNTPDSRWIAEIGFEGNSTDTSLSKDTPADISGTFTSGELERHTRSGGVVTYIGLEDITENITVSAAIENGTGGGKRNIQVHLLLDTGSGFSIVATHNASMSAEAISLSFTKATNLSTGDKYKAQVENIENNDDMLVIDLTIVGVKV